MRRTPEHNAAIGRALKGRRLSRQTRERISDGRRGPGDVVRVCEACGGTFTAEKPSSKQRFCSRACGYRNRSGRAAANWRPDIPVVICPVCKVAFRQKTVRQTRKTCSMTCRNIWQRRNQRNSRTDIERLFEAALCRSGIAFEAQKPLCNTTISDFFLPDYNTAVFCDGDYWHGLPGKAEHDAKKTAALQAAGFRVCRFLGSAIKADIASCVAEAIRPSSSGT